MAHLAYQPGRERPDYCGIYHADILTGVYAYGAIASALVQRQQTGQGQHIDVSMLESMLSLTQNEVQGAQFPIKPPQRPMFGPMETVGWLCDGRHRQRKDVPESGHGGRPAGIHPRSALCGLQPTAAIIGAT